MYSTSPGSPSILLFSLLIGAQFRVILGVLFLVVILIPTFLSFLVVHLIRAAQGPAPQQLFASLSLLLFALTVKKYGNQARFWSCHLFEST